MSTNQGNLSPARRAKRCALSLFACFSLVAGGLYWVQPENGAETPREYAKTVAADAGPSTVRYQSSN